MKKYTHNIPIHIILGIWTLFYMIPFFIAYLWFMAEHSAIFEIKTIIFYSLFLLSVSIILYSTIALLLKKYWSIRFLSLGLLLFIIAQIYVFILSGMSSIRVLFSFVSFTSPILPIIFILHSKYFINHFKNEKNDNESVQLTAEPPGDLNKI
jgi:hypothetical protein